jgi:hypothetical protein
MRRPRPARGCRAIEKKIRSIIIALPSVHDSLIIAMKPKIDIHFCTTTLFLFYIYKSITLKIASFSEICYHFIT